MKSFLLMMSLFTCMGFTTPISANEIAKENHEIVLNEDNEKVNIRQKAVKRESVENEPNIETTNVDYDLRYYYGKKNYLNYNIWNLLPTSSDSKDINFKFLFAKPVGTNLYLYLYHNDNRNSDILNATFSISKSKTLNSETHLFQENFALYNARFINSYGYKQRFIKFAIDNVINTSEDVRVFIDTCYITYQDVKTTKKYYSNTYSVADEFVFGVNDNGDFMYDYFKDNYVKVLDGEVSLLLTQSTRNGIFENLPNAWNEDFYYFFTTNYDITDLQEVQYDYQYVTYDATMKWDDMAWTALPEKGGVAYNGLLNGTGYNGKYQNAPKSINEINTQNFVNQRMEKSSYIVEVERPKFLWFNQKVQYKMSNIIDCLNLSSLENDEQFVNLKSFIEKVQNSRSAQGKSKYQWAFKVRSDFREINKWWNETEWWSWLILGLSGQSAWSETHCHEVKQALITWLRFRTDNQEFEFNVLDIPKDTSSIYLDEVPFKTLGDLIIEKAIEGFDWFKKIVGNVLKNIVPLAITILSIMLLVACWPVITSTMQLVSVGIKNASNKAQEKPKKKQKKKGNKKV